MPRSPRPSTASATRHLTVSSRLFRGLRAGLSPYEFREVMWQLPGGFERVRGTGGGLIGCQPGAMPCAVCGGPAGGRHCGRCRGMLARGMGGVGGGTWRGRRLGDGIVRWGQFWRRISWR